MAKRRTEISTNVEGMEVTSPCMDVLERDTDCWNVGLLMKFIDEY